MNTLAEKRLHPPLVSDFFLFTLTCLLVIFSIVMVYSTTGVSSQEKFGDAFYFVRRQGVAACVGMVMLFLCARMDLERLRRFSPWCLLIAIGLLLLPLIPGLGQVGGGAQRWIKFGFIRVQPAEFVKFFFVIFLAGYYARHEQVLENFVQGLVKPLAMATAVGALLLVQPDFGTTVIILAVTLCMGASAGVRLRYIIIGMLALTVVLSALVYISPYRMSRVLSFRTPWADASGKGYQLLQSLIAVGTGELTGKGLGGSQQKLFFLPAAHTDFIFAVVAEELGFIGCVCVISAFILFLWRGVLLATRMTEDTFAFSLAVGLTMLVVLPGLLNVGVVIGLLPTKGMVLPLVGYGGSALISSLMTVGLLLALARGNTNIRS